MSPTTAVRHRRLDLDGVEVFYREAGPADAPAVLLPHGYPCSSYEFRALMPLLADRWRLVAPDFPGCGLSATPEGYPYTFDGHADFLRRFAARVGLERFVLWLHDFGSQVGLRLAIAEPHRIAALIIQNGDVYEDTLGPQYAELRRYWDGLAGGGTVVEPLATAPWGDSFGMLTDRFGVTWVMSVADAAQA